MRPILLAAALLAGCAIPPPATDWRVYVEQERAAGRLRTDRAAADVPVTPDRLARNFRVIAFNVEADPLRNGVVQTGGEQPMIRKWVQPIVYSLIAAGGREDRIAPLLADYARRLSTITGHEVRAADAEGLDTRVMVVFASDAAFGALSNPATFSDAGWQGGSQGMDWIVNSIMLWRRAPSPCGAFVLIRDDTEVGRNGEILFGLVLIRAEVPDLLLKACVEEEMAQMMGAMNDDASVRPSVFNDDQEFALLTRHDMELLRVLYDPAIRPGMGPDTAMAIAEQRFGAR